MMMTLYSKEKYYNTCRTEAANYLADSLAKSTVNEEIKKIVGKTMIMLYGKIFHDEDILKDREIFCELDSNFLYAIDLINIYILDVPCMQKDEDPVTHIGRIRDKNIRELVLNLYDISQDKLK